MPKSDSEKPVQPVERPRVFTIYETLSEQTPDTKPKDSTGK